MAKPPFRQAAKNLGWLLAERGFRFFFGAVVGFVVARYLGPAQLGSLSYCLSVVTLFGCVAGFGVDAVIKRDLLQHPGQTAQLLAAATVLRLLAGLVATLGLGLYAFAGPSQTEGERMLFIILGFLLWQPALMVPELWLHAQLRARAAVLAQVAALGISAGVRLVLVRTGASLPAFAAVSVMEALLVGAGLHLAVRWSGLRISWLAVSRESLRRLAGESAPLVLAGLAIIIYMKIDEVMLRQMAGVAEVGIYSAATRLTEIWYFIPAALASSLLPALMRARATGVEKYENHLQRYYDLNATIAYVLSVPMALLAPWLVRVAYGEAFLGSAAIVAVHIWSCVFVFLGVARGQWLVNERLQKFYLWATLAGAALNIGLNLAFIPRWGGLGAAVATVISQASAAWLSSFFSAEVRTTGWMQTRALLVPLLGWRYLFSR